MHREQLLIWVGEMEITKREDTERYVGGRLNEGDRSSKYVAPLKNSIIEHVLSCNFLKLLIVTVKGILNPSCRSED